MELGFDLSMLEKLGITGVVALALIVVIFGIKSGLQLFQLFMEQWKNSTDAVNKNTDAFMELSNFFKRANEKEEQFQKDIMAELRDGVRVARDTNERVKDIQHSLPTK